MLLGDKFYEHLRKHTFLSLHSRHILDFHQGTLTENFKVPANSVGCPYLWRPSTQYKSALNFLNSAQHPALRDIAQSARLTLPK